MNVYKPELQETLDQLYEKADNIRPLAEKNGEVFVTFEDAAVLNSLNAQNAKIGTQTRNPDGTLARTGKRVHAVNPDYFFANRAMKKAKKLYVVSGHTVEGYRCIKEQSSGHTFLKMIPAYVISRNDNGDLYVENRISISDTDFIKDYTLTLSNAVMAEIMPLIVNYSGGTNRIDEMPI